MSGDGPPPPLVALERGNWLALFDPLLPLVLWADPSWAGAVVYYGGHALAVACGLADRIPSMHQLRPELRRAELAVAYHRPTCPLALAALAIMRELAPGYEALPGEVPWWREQGPAR